MLRRAHHAAPLRNRGTAKHVWAPSAADQHVAHLFRGEVFRVSSQCDGIDEELWSRLPHCATTRTRGRERIGRIGVIQRDEVEAFRRDGGAGARAVAQLEYLRDIVWRETAFADINKRADDFSHHVAEERAAANDV